MHAQKSSLWRLCQPGPMSAMIFVKCFYLSVCLSVCLSLCTSVLMVPCLSVSPFFVSSMFLSRSVYLSFLTFSLCLFIYFWVCLFLLFLVCISVFSTVFLALTNLHTLVNFIKTLHLWVWWWSSLFLLSFIILRIKIFKYFRNEWRTLKLGHSVHKLINCKINVGYS